MPSTPVIFLAFANEKESEVRYLRALSKEQAQIKEALEPAVAAGLCEVVVESNATVTSIIDTFQRARYRERIAVFHYGGHADGYQLLLETLDQRNEVAHGAGLVAFFSKQDALRLIFLNGCSTQQQATELVTAGVPAVIGTSQSIADDVATQLATRFYQSIGQGATLDRAWREAEAEIKIRKGTASLRSAHFTTDGDQLLDIDQSPWDIHYREGAEIVRDWNLPQAAGNPLFGLPELPRDFDLPERPYRFLRRFERRHAEIFFGRGQYIRDVYQRLRDPHAAPVLLFYGQSGVGKSSLLEAGVLPRLEQSCTPLYLRRDPDGGLKQTILHPFGLTAETDAAALKTAWLERERLADRPLIIILDQVEEVFTRPRKGFPHELEHFLQVVQTVFDDPRDRPAGKLVLGYRKEFHPEVVALCRQLEIPREAIFVDKLDRAAIIEVVTGLTSTERLRRRYRLSIEDNLPTVIADDLLVDPNSAIAPVLQILLTKMWDLSSAGDTAPRFTVAEYNDLRKAGILLDDFYAEQMAQLRAWNADVVDSGLGLDLLNLHTTGMGTAGSRDLEEIRTRYQHRADLLDPLLDRLKNLYLLTSVGEAGTGLTHDALAPIVQREIKDSDKPGQRALRILLSKLPEYEYSPDTVYIDEEDLALVERGAGGMRLWTRQEEALVEQSRARRARLVAERRRNRRLKIGGVVVIALLAIVASVLAWRSNRQAQTSAFVNQALNQKGTDATRALNSVYRALAILPEDPSALQARHDIYAENEFYGYTLPQDTSLVALRISPDGQLIAAAAGKAVRLWKTNDPTATEPVKTLPHDAELRSISFSPDGQRLISVDRNNTAFVWPVGGSSALPLHTLSNEQGPIVNAVFSPDGRYLLTGGQDGAVSLRTASGDSILWTRSHGADLSVTSLGFSGDGQYLASGSIQSTTVRLWNLAGEEVSDFLHAANVTALAFHPTGSALLTGCREDKTAYLWPLGGGEPTPLRGHQQRINEVAFTPNGKRLLTASMDGTVKSWDSAGRELKTYRGHDGMVFALATSPDGRHFASGDEYGQVRWWQYDSKVEQTFGPHAKGVLAVAFAPNGETLISATGNGEQELVLALSDPNMTEELLNQLLTTLPQYPVYAWSLGGERKDSMSQHQAGVIALDYSPDLSYCLSAGDGGQAILWNRATGETTELTGHRGDIQTAAFSPDGQQVATAGEDSTVILWNRQGDSLAIWPHPNMVASLAFSPDGSYLLTGDVRGVLRRRNLATAASETFPGQWNMIRSLAYSLDGEWLAAGVSGGPSAIVYLLTPEGILVDSMTIDAQNRTGGRGVNTLAFSPDGRQILAGAEGGVAMLFDLAGRPLQRLDDFDGSGVNSVGFSPDGQWIAAGSGDGWVRLFPNLVFQNPWPLGQ